jgi:parallel beta-helix repeat protein
MKIFARHLQSHTPSRTSFRSRLVMATTLPLVVGMIGMPQAEAAQREPTQVRCGGPTLEIKEAGEYVLADDCSVGPGDAAIYISSSGVYLNLNGFTVSGPGFCDAPTSIGILVGASDVHIVGGPDPDIRATVRGFVLGIQVQGLESAPIGGSHLTGLRLTDNCTSVQLRDTTDSYVSDSEVTGSLVGVGLQRARGSAIHLNELNNNGIGIWVDAYSTRNAVSSNTFTGPGNLGVYVDSSTHNTVLNNIFNTEGIRVSRSNNNTIHDNTFSNGYISLLGGVSGNFVYRNQAGAGSYFYDDDCTKNFWADNQFERDSEGDGPGSGCIR